MSKNDKIEKDDAGSKIALLPPAGAYAKQKHEFRALVQELKRLARALVHPIRSGRPGWGFRFLPSVSGRRIQTLANPEHVERLKKFLSSD
jgi:hypothetical protein